MSEYQANNGWAVDGKVSATVQASTAGDVPILDSDARLPGSIIPDVAVPFTVPADAWEGEGPYTANITVADAAEIATPIIGADAPDGNAREVLAGAQITATAISSAGVITLVADGDKPTVPINCVATGTKGTQTGKLLSAFGAGGGSTSFFLNITINASAGSPDLSGITVTAVPGSGTTVTGTTTSSGTCTLTVKQGQVYTVTCFKTDFTFSPSSATAVIQDTSSSLEFSCYEAPKLTITCAGTDIGGRTVTCTPEDGDVITATTGTDGKVTIKLGIADYTVTVDYPDGQGVSPTSATVSASAGGSYAKTFTVLTKPTLSLTVTDKSSAGYQSGRTITATPTTSGSTITAQTDSDGTASLILMAGTSYVISCDAPTGYVIPNSYPLTPQAGQAYTYAFDLYEEAKVNVTVTPSAIASGRTITATADGMSPITKTTSSDGTCTLSLPAGSWTIACDAPSTYYTPSSKTQVTVAGETYSMSFALDAHPLLNVTVTPQASAGSLLVKAIGDTTVTGYTTSAGTCTLTLEEDEYTVSVSAPSGYLTPATQSVTATKNNTYPLTFALQAKPTVVVTVTDSSGGSGGQGRTITAKSSDGSDIVTASTGTGTSATLTLNGTGSYTITTDTPEGATADSSTITVEGGGSYTATLTLSFGWLHSIAVNTTTMQTDPEAAITYADGLAGYTPVRGTGSSLAKCSQEGEWAFSTETGMDIEDMFYATFRTGSSGQYLHQLLNPYNLAQVLAVWDDDAKEWDYSQTGSSAITSENTMLCIPTQYRKGQDGKVSHSSISSNGTAYAHTIGGHTYDYLAVGVYLGYNQSSVLKSISGVTASASITRPNFRTYAAANSVRDGKAMQWNYHMWQLMKEKAYMRAKGFNVPELTGRGGLSYSASTTGLCNALGPYAGNVGSTGNAQKFLIENMWASLRQWIDDAYYSGNSLFVGQNVTPTDDTSNKTEISGFDASINGTPLTIKMGDLSWGMGDTAGGSNTTGLCDYQYLSADSSGVAPGVGGYSYESSGAAGPGYFYRYSVSNSNAYIGARLAFVFDV